MRFDDSLHPPLAILAKIVPLFPIIRRLTMKTTVAFLICLIVVVVRGQGQFHCDVKAPCGCSPSRPTTILSRIIGGEDAQKDAWPWMVSIRDGSGDFCGGTVLNSQWILTATHCFFPNPSIAGLKIVAGSLFIPTKSNNIQIRSVARIISHPHYGDRTSRNDITLLLLRAPLNLTGNSVRPICLPPAGRLLPEDNATMVAIGWGTNSTKHLMYPSNLQQVTVRSINRRMFGCPGIIYYPRQHFCAGLPKGGKGWSVLKRFLQI